MGVICISLISNDLEHLVLIGHLYVFGEMSVQILADFNIGLSIYC